jgi:hypothetical protein
MPLQLHICLKLDCFHVIKPKAHIKVMWKNQNNLDIFIKPLLEEITKNKKNYTILTKFF